MLKQQIMSKRTRGWTLATLAGLLTAALLPQWWVQSMMKAAEGAVHEPTVLGMEVFSGTAERSRAFSDVAGEFLTFEKLDSDKEDVMTTAGLNLLLQRVCRIQSHGILWMGTPCRSWVASSRS